METGPRLKVSSDRLVKPGIEPATPGLQGKRFTHYTTSTSNKPRYDTFQKANNKGADQTARMRRLVCACVIRNTPKTGFLAPRPNYIEYLLTVSN